MAQFRVRPEEGYPLPRQIVSSTAPVSAPKHLMLGHIIWQFSTQI